jgi:hypothetical protein
MAKDIQKYFNAHPGVDKFYFTSDGMAFFKREDATAHARTLPDKKVEEKNRVAAPVAGLGDASTGSGKKGGKKVTPATNGDDQGKTDAPEEGGDDQENN